MMFWFRHILESMDTTEAAGILSLTISVQGHGDYPTEQVLENPEIIVGGVEDEGKRNAWEYYVNEVHEMDKFAGSSDPEAYEERGMNRPLLYFTEIIFLRMGLEAKDMKSRYLYNTNYVIWDNIGLEKKDMNLCGISDYG